MGPRTASVHAEAEKTREGLISSIGGQRNKDRTNESSRRDEASDEATQRKTRSSQAR